MTKPDLFRILLLLLALPLSGCGPMRASLSVYPVTGDWDALSQDEWRTHEHADAYYVIQRLRPAWLAGREAGSYGLDPQDVGESQVRVYVDGILSSTGMAHLRAIPAHDLLEVRHLSPMDATLRFGTGHSAGAILVVTRAGR